ncbi:MAG: amino acid carrier protein, partial [Treponema sp.]|nr:amino acid carrier protein [Treponema sp.]
INTFMWGPPMLIVLFGGGVFMTVALGFFQFKHFGFIMRNTLGKIVKQRKEGEGTVSAFQAATSALCNTIGASNIVGVPVAIAMGGPGAIFWMWAAGAFGLAIKWAEITLGVHYREKDKKDGTFVGGPAHYLSKGLKKARWLGPLFAFALMLEIVPSIGSQAVAASENLAGVGIPKIYTGIFIAILAGIVVFGGIKRIGKFSEKFIPITVLAYSLFAWIIILMNFTQIPAAFGLIFKAGFTPQAAVGGFAGATVAAAARWGVARGVYSNEAGMGQAAIAHSAAVTDHPARQGMWAIFEVVMDTAFANTTTALLVLTTGLWRIFTPDVASTIPAEAIGTVFGLGFARYFIAVMLFLFVFTTVIGNAFYGEQMARYLFGHKFSKFMLGVYLVFVVIASTSDIGTLYNFIDLLLVLVVVPNVVGVCLQVKTCRQLKQDFFDNEKYCPQKAK